jgi:prophage maintenance system killer protein
MAVSHKWQPVTDLGENPNSLTDGELASLRRVWADQKKELIESGALEEFDKRLRREWAIETGIIENVYTLDRGVTQTLIEKGIDAALIPPGASDRDSTLVARIVQDHYDALDGMFDFVRGQRELSTSYVRELHAALLRNETTYTAVDQFGTAFQKLLQKGEYKTDPNSPTRPDGLVHQYCPPEHVASEMDQLIRFYGQHRDVAPEVQAAWLHHRFTQIHPFADGNGRVARAIASLVFIKAGWFPLIIKRDDWTRDIESLEKADAGDLRPLVAMFVEEQRNALIQATEVAYEVKPIASAEEAIASVRERLAQRGILPPRAWLAASRTADRLQILASQRFEYLADRLTEEIGASDEGFWFRTVSGQPSGVDEPNKEVVQRAGHIADFTVYNGHQQLAFHAMRPDALTLSFHALGPRYRGIIGVVAHLSIYGAEPALIEGGTFLINYEEDLNSAEIRFLAWLEHVVIEGLKEWRRTL